jgi:hypothetical protein
MAMMLEMLLMTVTLTLTVITVPRIYWGFIRVEQLYLDQEVELLQTFLVERNAWIMRHIGFGLGALTMLWISRNNPGMEIPSSLGLALGVYAASCLVFALLEGLLAQKVERILTGVPVRVRTRD